MFTKVCRGIASKADTENQAPTDISLSEYRVGENEPVGTVVGTFSTTDPDAGDTFTYSLVAGTGDEDNGSFTIDGNQLKTAAVFDYETKSSYSVRVRSTDQGALWLEEVFTITVVDGAWDFGDAPDTGVGAGPGNYQTLQSDGGAAHDLSVAGPFMGATVDREVDGQPSVARTGTTWTGGTTRTGSRSRRR